MNVATAQAAVVRFVLGAVVPHAEAFISSFGQQFTQSRVQPSAPDSVTPAGYFDLGQADPSLSGAIFQLRSFLAPYNAATHSEVLTCDQMIVELVNPRKIHFDEYVAAGGELWVPSSTFTRVTPGYLDMATGQRIQTRAARLTPEAEQLLRDAGVDPTNL